AVEPQLTPEALNLLKRYRWPGNIRELRNVIERAVLLAPDRIIGLDALPVEKLSAQMLSDEKARLVAAAPAEPGSQYEVERKRILDALEKCAGNQTLAAKMLGISRRTMLTRLDQYAIPRPRKGKAGEGPRG